MVILELGCYCAFSCKQYRKWKRKACIEFQQQCSKLLRSSSFHQERWLWTTRKTFNLGMVKLRIRFWCAQCSCLFLSHSQFYPIVFWSWEDQPFSSKQWNARQSCLSTGSFTMVFHLVHSRYFWICTGCLMTMQFQFTRFEFVSLLCTIHMCHWKSFLPPDHMEWLVD